MYSVSWLYHYKSTHSDADAYIYVLGIQRVMYHDTFNLTLPIHWLYQSTKVQILTQTHIYIGIQRVMYHDAFNLTLPMIEAAAGDCGHFLPANIQMALVQQFLNLVCPVSA
jgi:hypothetical protein